MTEPTSAAAGAYAGAVTALPLAIFGAATDALWLGLFAALLVSIWMPTISTRIRAFSAVLLSGVAAGYCPVGVEFTTKRKYVEVLLRKREIKIDTRHEDATVEKPINRVTRRAVHRSPLSVLADQNPKGRAWLAQMMRE